MYMYMTVHLFTHNSYFNILVSLSLHRSLHYTFKRLPVSLIPEHNSALQYTVHVHLLYIEHP